MDELAKALLEQLKKNEVYLQKIALSQTELLEISKKTLLTERYRVVIMGLKFLFILILTWVSVVYLEDMIKGLMTTIGTPIGVNNTTELGGVHNLTQQLKSSQDLMREIMGR